MVSTEVFDDGEIANFISSEITDAAVKQISEVVNTTKQSLSNCEDCGADIPKERQEAIKGCTLCIDCQQWLESKKKKIGSFNY